MNLTLSRLIQILSSVQGGGHPVVFRTPDGKCYIPKEVVNSGRFTDTETEIKTIIVLEKTK